MSMTRDEFERLVDAMAVAVGHHTWRNSYESASAKDAAKAALLDAFEKVAEAGYLAGFEASGEGWNGEWPCSTSPWPEGDQRWQETRERDLQGLGLKSPPPEQKP